MHIGDPCHLLLLLVLVLSHGENYKRLCAVQRLPLFADTRLPIGEVALFIVGVYYLCPKWFVVTRVVTN